MLINAEFVQHAEPVVGVETPHGHDTLTRFILGEGHRLLLRLGHSPDRGTSGGGHHTLHKVGRNLPVESLLLGALLSGGALLSRLGVQFGEGNVILIGENFLYLLSRNLFSLLNFLL